MRGFFGIIAGLLLLAGCAARAPAPEPGGADAGPVSAAAALVTHPRFADADPVAWAGRGPWAYAVHGLDVSRWQGEIDWDRARAAGIAFAFIKATEGGDRLDPMFEAHWRGAGRAGVRRGAYHYFYFCRPAAEQARWFIRNVPKAPGDLPHVLDMEWTPHSPTCTRRPDGAHVRREAEVFLDMLERLYGRRPILYTTVDSWRDTGIGRLKRTEFWLRSVAAHPEAVYGGAPWTFWQYTGTGEVPGVSGPVDINAFAGSAAAWARRAEGRRGPPR